LPLSGRGSIGGMFARNVISFSLPDSLNQDQSKIRFGSDIESMGIYSCMNYGRYTNAECMIRKIA
jgi:hypothetical protein